MATTDETIAVRDFIQAMLEEVSTILDTETRDAVSHYIDHDEYEMAFEGLFIEIMKVEVLPSLDYKKCREIAVLLRLDQEYDSYLKEEIVYEINFLSLNESNELITAFPTQ